MEEIKEQMAFLVQMRDGIMKSSAWKCRRMPVDYTIGHGDATRAVVEKIEKRLNALSRRLPPEKIIVKKDDVVEDMADNAFVVVCKECGSEIERHDNYGYSKCNECGEYGTAVFRNVNETINKELL